MRDLPQSRELLLWILDELMTFKCEMGSTGYPTPSDCFTPCFKLVLSADYIDAPRSRESLPRWLRDEKRRRFTVGELWWGILRQADELQHAVQQKLEGLDATSSLQPDLETLALGPAASNLVTFLRGRPKHSATVLEVARWRYPKSRVPTKRDIKYTRQLIRRTARKLEDGPIQISVGRDDVSLIGC
jgi:hypothetical protein